MVADSGKVEPLWMAKFIAHECEVAFTSEATGDQTDHFMQGHTTIDDRCERAHFAHVRVHFTVHEPKGKALVADEGLVMAFAIGNCFFLITNERGQIRFDLIEIFPFDHKKALALYLRFVNVWTM